MKAKARRIFEDNLSDMPITEEECNKANDDIDNMEEESVKDVLKDLKDYLGSKEFFKDCNKESVKTGKSPKECANNFLLQVANVIGSTLGTGVDVINVTVNSVIGLIDTVLTKAVDIICNVVRGLIGVITFGQYVPC